MLGKLWTAVSRALKFKYDAVDSTGRRKAVAPNSRPEDSILDSGRRSKLIANARDLHRNYSLAAWAIRRHLDYVAAFEFQARTPDKEFNKRLERLVAEWSKPHNFDAAGRHSLNRFVRIVEARAVLDGDVGILKLRDGRLQAIESDRIRNQNGSTHEGEGEWVHGVRVNSAGRALAYAIAKRTHFGGLEFEREVPARNLCLHGYFDRFDQVRGVSPLASALNPFRDTYEASTYALSLMKVQQFFSLIINRKAGDQLGVVSQINQDETEPARKQYEIDLGRGPGMLDMDPGDDAKFLQSNNPSGEFQQFTRFTIDIALKALDIPFSFYDEAHTNFFGSRGAWLHYERACEAKRQALGDLLTRLTWWRIVLWWLNDELELPAGTPLEELAFEWFPSGVPWWDPAKEIAADLSAVSAGFDTPQRITKERGRGDWFDNIDRIAEARAYAAERGVPVNFTPASTAAPEPADPRDAKPKD